MKIKKVIFIPSILVCFILLSIFIKMNTVTQPAPMDIVTDTEGTEGTEGTEDDISASDSEKQKHNDIHDLVYRTYSLGKVFYGDQIFILKDDLLSVMENLQEIAVVCDGKLYTTIPYEDADWSCDIVKEGTYYLLAVNSEGKTLDVTEYAWDVSGK